MPTLKTSTSHPLRIDPVIVEQTGGVIGMTFCPGKKQSISQAGPWDRNLDLDLKAIADFGAEAVVSLLERDEHNFVKVPVDELRKQTEALDIEFHHLPIRDADIPNETFEDHWTYSGLRLRKSLREGKRIVIFCRGGLGRTGVIATRLLVEFGLDPANAMQKARTARPGTIENELQQDYVIRCRPLASAFETLPLIERVLGCLLGGALGDALGYAVEFDSLAEIRSRFGSSGIREPVHEKGRHFVSDDTQMTLFTLEGLLSALSADKTLSEAAIVKRIWEAYLDWLGTQEIQTPHRETMGDLAKAPQMVASRAPGNTCLSSLSSGRPGSPDNPTNNSKGCGGVMRVAPVGLFPHHFDPETAFRLGAKTAAVTHGHPSGYLSAGMMAALIRLLVGGVNLFEAIHGAWEILNTWPEHEETTNTVQLAIKTADSIPDDHADAIKRIGEGWVGEEALAIALYAVLAGQSQESPGTYKDVVAIAANHAGDSDSTASIAGQIWGAWRGLEGIPHKWVVDIDVLGPLLSLARRLEESLVPSK